MVYRLASEQIPLTVCPLSNVRLRVVRDLAQHPLPTMLERFGGYVDHNYAAFGLSTDTLRTLAANSIRASFLDDARKATLLSQLHDQSAL
jgi:adenosine deaminase